MFRTNPWPQKTLYHPGGENWKMGKIQLVLAYMIGLMLVYSIEMHNLYYICYCWCVWGVLYQSQSNLGNIISATVKWESHGFSCHSSEPPEEAGKPQLCQAVFTFPSRGEWWLPGNFSMAQLCAACSVRITACLVAVAVAVAVAVNVCIFSRPYGPIYSVRRVGSSLQRWDPGSRWEHLLASYITLTKRSYALLNIMKTPNIKKIVESLF